METDKMTHSLWGPEKSGCASTCSWFTRHIARRFSPGSTPRHNWSMFARHLPARGTVTDLAALVKVYAALTCKERSDRLCDDRWQRRRCRHRWTAPQCEVGPPHQPLNYWSTSAAVIIFYRTLIQCVSALHSSVAKFHPHQWWQCHRRCWAAARVEVT